MHRLLHRLCPAFAVVAVALPLAARAQETVVERAGTFAVVHCHGFDEAVADEALAAVEKVWPFAAPTLGADGTKPPAAPLVVHLYRTIAGYEAAEQQLTNGKFRRNLAMFHHASRTAHVALQPPCSDETLRAVGLPAMTVELLAWEASHVARARVFPNFEVHPMWFVDGFAATNARKVLDAVRGGGRTEISVMAQEQQRLVLDLARDKKLPKARAILRDGIDDLDFHPRYAARAVFYAMLQTPAHADRRNALLRTVGGLASEDAWAKSVDGTGLDQLDAAFAKFVAGLQPTWSEVHRSLALDGKRMVQIAFPERNAIAWCRQPVKGAELNATGSLRILPAAAQQMNFLFGRTEAGDFYSVAFTADRGVTLFRYRSKGDEWTELGFKAVPALRLGYSTAFQITAKRDAVTILVGDVPGKFALPDALPDAAPWGIGAQAGPPGAATGSAGIWEDLVVRGKG